MAVETVLGCFSLLWHVLGEDQRAKTKTWRKVENHHT